MNLSIIILSVAERFAKRFVRGAEGPLHSKRRPDRKRKFHADKLRDSNNIGDINRTSFAR